MTPHPKSVDDMNNFSQLWPIVELSSRTVVFALKQYRSSIVAYCACMAVHELLQ